MPLPTWFHTAVLLLTKAALEGATKADVDEQMVLRMMAGIEIFMIVFYFVYRYGRRSSMLNARCSMLVACRLIDYS
jgi:hypothetical protein